jgi:hypothetical protein
VSIVKRTLSNRFFGGVPFEINSIENKVQENKNNSLLHSNWKKKKYDNWITTAFTSHTNNRT